MAIVWPWLFSFVREQWDFFLIRRELGSGCCALDLKSLTQQQAAAAVAAAGTLRAVCCTWSFSRGGHKKLRGIGRLAKKVCRESMTCGQEEKSPPAGGYYEYTRFLFAYFSTNKRTHVIDAGKLVSMRFILMPRGLR